MVELARPADAEALDALENAAGRLDGQPDIERVLSPTRASIVVPAPDGERRLAPAAPKGAHPSRIDLALQALSRPPYVDNLLSADRRVAVVGGVLRPDRLDFEPRRRLRDSLAEVGASLQAHPAVERVRTAGYPVHRVALSELVQAEGRRLGPWVLLALALVIGLATRRSGDVLITLMVAGSSALWGSALSGLLGMPPNILSPGVTVVVVVLAVSDALHFLARHSELADAERTTAELIPRCVLTSLTTAVAFAALSLTGVPMIRDFGLQVALGVGSALAVTILIVPPWLRRRAATGPGGLIGWGLGPLDRLSSRAPGAIVVAAAAFTAAGLAAGSRVPVNSPLLADLDPDHPVRRTYAFLDERLGGLVPLDVLIEAPEGAPREALYSARRVGLAAELTERLRRLPEVRSATSVADLLTALSPLLKKAGADDALGLLPSALLLARDDARTYVDDEADLMRIRLRTANLGTAQALALFDRIAAEYEAVLHEPVGRRLTGQGYLAQVVNSTLVERFSAGFWLALLAVLLTVLVGLRSPRLALAALLPNLLPVAAVLGAMAVLGIDLRYTSALVLTVVFAIAVDDSVHFLAAVRAAPKDADPVSHGYAAAGRGIAITSCALAVGFLVLIASDFLPNRVLGGLLALTAATALVGDLVVLPALLRWTSRAR